MLLLAIAPSYRHCLLLCLFLPSVTSQEAKDDLVDFRRRGLALRKKLNKTIILKCKKIYYNYMIHI